MPVLANIGELCTCRDEGGQGDIHAIADAALVWEGERIVWTGAERDLPAPYHTLERWDAQHKLVTPGLVDCHTHLVFGGFREHEFARRLAGESYLEIARAGGGIRSTMRDTRAATRGELVHKALPVLAEMAALGVTTVEAKSGYGLSYEHELKLLEAVSELRAAQPVELVPTLLAAHIVPPEFASDRASYVRMIVDELIPEVSRRQLARFCDVFVEETAFTLEEAREILLAGRAHGLLAKLHADQLSDGGGGALAAELGARSADHLEHASDQALLSMAEHGVVAVTLPLASLYTFDRPLDARRVLQMGVRVAVATDYNPGSAPSYHLPLALMLACTLSRLTPHEALKGATLHAAHAIGLEHVLGSLEPGKQADFVIHDAPSANHWLYQFRAARADLTVKRGRVIHGAAVPAQA
jgi:imidazolonepropionase